MRVSKNEQIKKYKEFIEELHGILKVTDHVKISNLTKKHRVSTFLALSLADMRVIEKIKRSHYKWIAGEPSMIMTYRLINAVRAQGGRKPLQSFDQLEILPQIKPDAATERGLKEAIKQLSPPPELISPVKEEIKTAAPVGSKMRISFAWGLFKFEK